MDVSHLLDSMGEDSRRSSILFGIHSESKALQELERVQRQNRRFSLIAALAIFLLVAALICLIVYDLYRNRPELIPPQSWQATEDVDIAPQEDTRRWGKEEEEGDINDEAIVEEKYANHRYEPLGERTGLKPQPFHLPKEQNSSANHVFPSPPGFTPPVRFRGIYIHPTQHPDERNQEYYQKINELFTKPKEHLPDSDPVNSDLYTKAVYPSRQAIWNRKNSKPTRKPFTVMLDIYPMDRDENRHLVEGQKPRDTIFIPMRQYPQQQRPVPSQYIPQVMLPPRQQRNRMFMKLNLFPKERTAQKRTWNMRQDDGEDYEEDYEDEEEEDEDEDEEEEPEEHNCNGIVGHNPYGKPITAKWKAKNGEWVHAKYVALNQWNDEKDPR